MVRIIQPGSVKDGTERNGLGLSGPTDHKSIPTVTSPSDTTWAQAVLDALADAETLRINGTRQCQRRLSDAASLGAMVPHAPGPDVAYAAALYAAHAAFRAVPALLEPPCQD